MSTKMQLQDLSNECPQSVYFLLGNAVSGLSISGGNGHEMQDTPGLPCLKMFGQMTRVLSKNMPMQISW